MKKLSTFFFILCCFQFATSQIIFENSTVLFSGKVVDLRSNQPLEYATISLKKSRGDKIIGTTTDKNGEFSIRVSAGVYDINISFLSYKTHEIKTKVISDDLNLGLVRLNSDDLLDEVDVTAEAALISHEINKKIYNASADIANRGGNGLDVLSNTPSVKVDSEGSITVRGSQVMVLINGKPQFDITNNNEILRAIPSSSIDRVEIITRSAKYSAEGGGAILNIITNKKKKDDGINGAVNVHTGIPDNHGFSTYLTKGSEKINLYTTLRYINENRIKEIDFVQSSLGLSEDINEDRIRNSFLFNLGSDFYLDSKNTLSASFLVNKNNKNIDYEILENDFSRNTINEDDYLKLEGAVSFVSNLDTLGQKLTVNLNYQKTNSDANDAITEEVTGISTPIMQQSFKDQSLSNILAQLDYTYPINKESTLELGYKGTIREYENIFKVEEFDEDLNSFMTLNDIDDTFNYNEDVHAFYAMYNHSKDKFSYSLGLRTEISDVLVSELNKDQKSESKYTDFFPSLSMAYEFSDDSFLSLNYSRSINRPSIPQLSPFLTFFDQRFQSIGNQNLNPYYMNYFELLYDQNYSKLSFATSIFMNFKKDAFLSIIENTGLQTNNGDTIFSRKYINSGDYNIVGIDLDITYRPFNWLRYNSYINPAYEDISGTINGDYDNTNVVWYIENGILFSTNTDLRIKASHVYQSAIINGQTSLKALQYTNISISQDLFKKKASLTFKANDVFRSKRFLYVSKENNIETNYDVYYQNQFSLTFSYRFNESNRYRKDRSNDINKDELEDKQDKKF